jgi:hypothetical protein
MTSIIFIVGMHRSGTSMTAGILEKLHTFLGNPNEIVNTYNGSTHDNLYGYKEHGILQTINNNLLGTFDASWDNPKELPKDWFYHPEVGKQLNIAREFILSISADAKQHGFETITLKDPRTSLLIPFWKKIVDELNISYRFVWTVRNPIDVAKSIALRRYHTRSFDLGLFLWEKYNQSILKSYNPTHYLISFYIDWFGINKAQTYEKLVRFLTESKVSFIHQPLSEIPISPESNHFISPDELLNGEHYTHILALYKHILHLAGKSWQSRQPSQIEYENERIVRLYSKSQEKLSQYETYFSNGALENSDYVPLRSNTAPVQSVIKLIAFYLPQFHPIPENDTWWGKGFTEWTNVGKAKPRFEGHYQPRLPGELGYYDLRIPDVIKRQVELAKLYGIYGFCFHVYWFGGKRLLERPVNYFIEDRSLDFPYCFCWANENWTRRWDGQEHEILIEQKYSTDDDLAFITEFAKSFSDTRYIRFENKPIIIIYRVSLLPNSQETIRVWRNYCRAIGIGEIYVIAAQAFEIEESLGYGCDAAVTFPPHGMPDVRDFHFNKYESFDGHLFNYERLVKHQKNVLNQQKNYPLFYTTFTGWDNTPRRPNHGIAFPDSSPRLYADWFHHVCQKTLKTMPTGSEYCFINAWNEWAEGTYLEPDQKYGYAFLEATSQVLEKYPVMTNEDINNNYYNQYLIVQNELELLKHEHAQLQDNFSTKQSELTNLEQTHLNKTQEMIEALQAKEFTILSLKEKLSKVENELINTANYAKDLRAMLTNPVLAVKKGFKKLKQSQK